MGLVVAVRFLLAWSVTADRLRIDGPERDGERMGAVIGCHKRVISRQRGAVIQGDKVGAGKLNGAGVGGDRVIVGIFGRRSEGDRTTDRDGGVPLRLVMTRDGWPGLA